MHAYFSFCVLHEGLGCHCRGEDPARVIYLDFPILVLVLDACGTVDLAKQFERFILSAPQRIEALESVSSRPNFQDQGSSVSQFLVRGTEITSHSLCLIEVQDKAISDK
jgi:hypothetical protein